MERVHIVGCVARPIKDLDLVKEVALNSAPSTTTINGR